MRSSQISEDKFDQTSSIVNPHSQQQNSIDNELPFSQNDNITMKDFILTFLKFISLPVPALIQSFMILVVIFFDIFIVFFAIFLWDWDIIPAYSIYDRRVISALVVIVYLVLHYLLLDGTYKTILHGIAPPTTKHTIAHNFGISFDGVSFIHEFTVNFNNTMAQFNSSTVLEFDALFESDADIPLIYTFCQFLWLQCELIELLLVWTAIKNGTSPGKCFYCCPPLCYFFISVAELIECLCLGFFFESVKLLKHLFLFQIIYIVIADNVNIGQQPIGAHLLNLTSLSMGITWVSRKYFAATPGETLIHVVFTVLFFVSVYITLYFNFLQGSDETNTLKNVIHSLWRPIKELSLGKCVYYGFSTYMAAFFVQCGIDLIKSKPYQGAIYFSFMIGVPLLILLVYVIFFPS